MDTNYLLKNEVEIISSSNKQVTLTTHRVIYDDKQIGKSKYTSIMLEKISSVEVHTKRYLVFLFLGIAIILAGLAIGSNGEHEGLFFGLIIGGVMLLVFFMTKEQVITIASDGGAKIDLQVSGLKRVALLKFVNQIDHAKDERGR